MRAVALWTSVATILTLDLILCLGLLDFGDTVWFSGALVALHLVLPLSTVLMVLLLLRRRQWIGVALFGAIVGGMLGEVACAVVGLGFSRRVHLCLDLAALSIYMAVVPWYYARSAVPIIPD